jgi:hypothetical protein
MVTLWIVVVHCVRAAFVRHANDMTGAYFGGSSRSSKEAKSMC